MTVLHLARHGQTAWHAENRYAGTSDIELSREGERQAEALARWADASAIESVVSSPLHRARATARAVAERTGVSHRIDDRLAEVDFGRGEGLTRDEMAGVFPADLQRFLAAPASHPLPGGEEGAVAAARGVAVLTELADAGADAVLVVAHSTLLRLTLCAVLGIDLDDYRRALTAPDNVSVTSIELGGTGPSGRPARGRLLRYNVPVS